MTLKIGIILTTILLNISAHSKFYALVQVPKVEVQAPSSQILVTQTSLSEMSGTYKTTNTELFFSNTLISDQGCEVELTGDSTEGTWQYFNSLGCDDDDSITFLTTDGLVKTINLWANANACEYLNNDWLDAAYNGVEGLNYNPSSCSLNGSDINFFISTDSLPAYYLNSVNIDVLGGGMMEGGEIGIGEGDSSQPFNMPNIQYIFNDLIIDHPFLSDLNISNLRYVLGDTIILRGMQNITSFDLSNLRNYYNSPLNINVMGAMNATELDISQLQNAGVIDLSYTSISDVSKFKNLKFGAIISNNDNEIYFPQVETFPSRNSNFCKGVRWGNITFSSSISQDNADEACE